MGRKFQILFFAFQGWMSNLKRKHGESNNCHLVKEEIYFMEKENGYLMTKQNGPNKKEKEQRCKAITI